MTARFLEQRTVDPADLDPYPGNPNVGDVDAIRASLRANGQYRAPVARLLPSGRLQVLAGHATRTAATAEGLLLRVDVVEADDATARRIVLADNRTAQLASYDEVLLLNLLREAEDDLTGTGWDAGWDDDYYRKLLGGDPNENPFDGPGGGAAYTAAVNIPQYQVVGPQPDLAELRDETRADNLRARIRSADIPGDVRDYLLAAAGRHTVFNYRKAAEFYPHASAEVQALMEESALVIIDVDDAIRLGYARLSATITELQEQDAGDDAESGVGG